MSSGRDKSRTSELVRIGGSLQPLGKNQAMKLMLEKFEQGKKRQKLSTVSTVFRTARN